MPFESSFTIWFVTKSHFCWHNWPLDRLKNRNPLKNLTLSSEQIIDIWYSILFEKESNELLTASKGRHTHTYTLENTLEYHLPKQNSQMLSSKTYSLLIRWCAWELEEKKKNKTFAKVYQHMKEARHFELIEEKKRRRRRKQCFPLTSMLYIWHWFADNTKLKI